MPIAYSQIEAAKTWLTNVDAAAAAAQKVGLPWFVMCAVLDKETGGKNVWGHDKGGWLNGYEVPVTEDSFKVFMWLLNGNQTDAAGKAVKLASNGVGCMQLTSRGFLDDMLAEGLKPWLVADNMLYGARLLRQYLTDAPRTLGVEQRVKTVGRRYNGSPEYGVDLWRVAKVWHGRVGSADNPSFRP